MLGSVKYLGMGDDDPFPGMTKKDNKVCFTPEASIKIN
jgi:hypothetical protein